MVFRALGMVVGLAAYARVGILEKKLKEVGVPKASFDSQKEIQKVDKE